MAFRKSRDFSYKDSIGVVSTDPSHVGPITRRKFKNKELDGSEYFTYLEMMKNNNSHTMVVTATLRGNLASVFFGEFSQISSNFGESEDSMDSPTSMNDVEESLAKSRFQNEKQYVLVAVLSIQQLQGMITNTIRPQYGGEADHASVAPNQKKCSRSTFLQFGSLTPIEVDFPRKTLEGSLEIENHEENKKVRRPVTLKEFFPKKFFCGSYIGATHVISSTDEIKESKGKHNPAITQDHQTDEKMSKKRTEEVSIKLSPSKGDKKTNIDEQQIFCYISRERQKKGQPLLEECTPQVHPPRNELSHTIFHDLKEKMTVPVAQVLSFTLESSKGNTQVGYNFSNPANLGELAEEVTGFSLSEPLWISSKKEKEITSPPYTSIEKTKESKEGKTPRRTLVFERIGRLTPRVSTFERLGHKDEKGSSK
ncbi:hypothetical protein H5410_056364 [Solanum commersonii]|uniref:Uncharacterized protein n=1 Tax=Solanum commersonii TaxID=4109 RepID=A0A9J5WMW2_SOLCO|nr:hypothetical protein H5410_056364 [Solanum commersonii]